MSIKHYGIWIAYPPTVDLRCEGLGRHLAAFLKGAAEKRDVKFTIACPSWGQQSIKELCESEDVPGDSIKMLYPQRYNILILIYEKFLLRSKKTKRWKPFIEFFSRPYNYLLKCRTILTENIATSRNIGHFIFQGFFLLPFLIAQVIHFSFLKSYRIFHKAFNHINKQLNFPIEKFLKFISKPKNSFLLVSLFAIIQKKEMELMLDLIDKAKHIKAWYSPTAFWPEFNLINAPKLMCIPDVVLAEFPIGFSNVNDERFVELFKKVEQAIYTGENFVTYSEEIKQNTVVKRYNRKAENIHVISHAPNNLNHLITIQGNSLNGERASSYYCQELFALALNKSNNLEYILQFKKGLSKDTHLKFFFYASQFRPSKNILTLLRAYKHLLNHSSIGHKLILTGNPDVCEEIKEFINFHHLEKDVLILTGLSLKELAACYKLADVVVNPSLSEGGCPFTLTEALSVKTPVIMANIPVTTEVITDPNLQELMLFDPYDWQSLADRLEWAVYNKEELLKLQLPVYEQLNLRTWRHVVDEYLSILDQLAGIVPDTLQQNKEIEAELA